ncbi:hypothetical protein JKF63_04665 [Porcisia hertigi]|uniref:BRCT domain-containing protein n=1 Tax=Porcisia hertigi TaxID=2761500 RepID=A0A836L8W2_9TRYP|nr:hypothetical protein JKF63_04665 [Porcisia hertigi]
MSSTATSCSPRLLSGVRVFLHIRHGDDDVQGRGGELNSSSSGIRVVKKRKGGGQTVSVRETLRTARAHVQQLGATLVLSEAAADLIVFHQGNASFLEAALKKFKTVVRPDYLAACIAADQRVSVGPYIVKPTASAMVTACASPAHESVKPSASAIRSPPTAADTPEGIDSGTMHSGANRVVAAVPSSSSSVSPSRATRNPQVSKTRTSTPAKKAGNQQQQQRGCSTLASTVAVRKEDAVAPSGDSPPSSSLAQPKPRTATNLGATRPLHALDDMSNSNANDSRCGAQTLQSGETGNKERPQSRFAGKSSTVNGVPGRGSVTRGKRCVPQVSTLAVEVDEDFAQRCSADSVPTPQLTPFPQHKLSSSESPGVGAGERPDYGGGSSSTTTTNTHQERVTAAVEKRSADLDEEEAIRHVVLRSTATCAVTQRRGRPPKQVDATLNPADTLPSLVSLLAKERNGLAMRGQDPFLLSEPSTQHPLRSQEASGPSPSDASGGEVDVTQPLPAVSPPPTQMTSKRHRSPSVAEDGYTEEQAHCTHHPPSLDNALSSERQRQRNRRSAVSNPICEAVKKSVKQRQQNRRQFSARQRGRFSSRCVAAAALDPECAPAADPPLLMTFTDLALLRRMTSVNEDVRSAAAQLCVCIFSDDGGGAASSSSSSFFLRDVVVQLGAVCLLLGGDDGEGQSCWFGHCTRTHMEQMPRMAKKPTHLVVSPHALLTPDVLYYKALGIPIVTPQWIYDAIALGAFPAILPHIHTHTLYGDGHAADAAVTGATPIVTAASATCSRDGLLGGEEDSGEAARAATRAVQRPLAHSTGDSTAPPLRLGGSSTLRRLHKEVAEEYVPAGEQAMRPFYAPIFQDRMFYLYVPPVDLENANASGGAAGPLRPSRVSRNSRNGSYLGGVTAALAQVTELLRVLGGTVTRNVESTYLDAVIDLTGFYDNMVEVGQTAREQQSQARTLRESLSCAYHDALQRVSQWSSSVHTHTASSPTPAPVLGIAWLIYSILTRQWTAVDSFILHEHPIAAQLAAVHSRPRACGIEAAVAKMTDMGAVGSSGFTPPTVHDAPDARIPPTPSAHEEAAESMSDSVWFALLTAAASPHLKRTRGPQASIKHPSHQWDTQEIASMLVDAQQEPLGAHATATLPTPALAFPSHHTTTTPVPFELEEEDNFILACKHYNGDVVGRKESGMGRPHSLPL